MPIIPKTEATFIDYIKITEVEGIDYIVHFLNTYTGQTWVFKIYKDLLDKSMEIRTIKTLDITVTNREEEEDKQKKEEDKKIARVYM